MCTVITPILAALLLSLLIYMPFVDCDEEGTDPEPEEVNFEWSETDGRFDCVVGITASGKPIGTGVFIAMDSVLTSANVVEDYVNNKDVLEVHVIADTYNQSKPRKVACIASVFGPEKNRKEGPFWLQHGDQEERENSPLHDLFSLSLEPIPDDLTDAGKSVIALPSKGDFNRDVNKRTAFMARMVWSNNFITDTHYMWGGFGYLNKLHIEIGNWMEMELYGDEAVVVDCDKWIPREWGHFICIENVNSVPGVASGAPLFNTGRLVGIGSFMLDKNNESMLAFTDIRSYSKQMLICVNFGSLHNDTNVEHGMANYSEIFAAEATYAKRIAY